MKWLKSKLRDWLFKDEQLEYQARLSAQKQLAESANIVALARQQLAGFDPQNIDFDTFHNYEQRSILDELDEEEAAHFLNEAHALYSNSALRTILDFLTRHQVLFGQKNAESLLALNFSRATINGLSLLWEEVEDAEGRWQQEHNKQPEPFDPHEPI